MKIHINPSFCFLLIWEIASFGCGEDYPSSSLQPVEDSPAEDSVQEVESPQRGEVSGAITDASTGEPIPGATVSLLDQMIETGTDGSYIFRQIGYSDALNLTATTPNHESKTLVFELKAEHLQLNLYLMQRFGAVSGVVTDANTGHPMPGIAVSLLDQSVETGADGKYVFRQIGYGEALNLMSSDTDYQPTAQVLKLETEHLVVDISLIPLTNPEAEIQQFLDTFSTLIESMKMDNLKAIQDNFSEMYLVSGDPVTRFGLATGVIPANFVSVIPAMTKLFGEFDAIQFRFRDIQVEVAHSRKASARLKLDVITQKGAPPDRSEITAECQMDFRKEGAVWKIVFWQLFKVEVQL